MNMFMQIFSPILLVIGIIGNLSNYYVFNKMFMKTYSTFRFLLYLSIIDLFVLIIGTPHLIFYYYIDKDFRNESNFMCSIHSFLTIFFSHLSSNVLAAVSVDRVFTLTSLKARSPAEKGPYNMPPNKQTDYQKQSSKANKRVSLDVGQPISNIKKTSAIEVSKTSNHNHTKLRPIISVKPPSIKKSRSKTSTYKYFTHVEKVILAIMFVLFLIDSHFLIWVRLNQINVNGTNETMFVCYPSIDLNPHYYWFFTRVWSWLDLLLYCYIPFTIMIICTTVIIFRLVKLSRSMKTLNKSVKNNLSSTRSSAFSTTTSLSRTSSTISQRLSQIKNIILPKREENQSSLITTEVVLPATNGSTLQVIDSNMTILKDKVSIKQPNDLAKRRARKNRQIYNTLLCLNFVFFILVTPVVTCNSFELLDNGRDFWFHKYLVALVYILAYSNHAFNFLFYLFSCKPYRDIYVKLYYNLKYSTLNLICKSRIVDSACNNTEIDENENNNNNNNGQHSVAVNHSFNVMDNGYPNNNNFLNAKIHKQQELGSNLIKESITTV